MRMKRKKNRNQLTGGRVVVFSTAINTVRSFVRSFVRPSVHPCDLMTPGNRCVIVLCSLTSLSVCCWNLFGVQFVLARDQKQKKKKKNEEIVCMCAFFKGRWRRSSDRQIDSIVADTFVLYEADDLYFILSSLLFNCLCSVHNKRTRNAEIRKKN